MPSRTTARLAAGATALGAALLCSTVSAQAALTAPQADAFFVSASGAINVAPTPHSTYPSGGTSTLVGLSVPPFATDATVTATTSGDPSTGNASAEAKAESLAVTLGALGTLNLGAIDSTCTATPSGATGSSSIASASFTNALGVAVAVNVPNSSSTVTIPGVASLQFFPQSTDSNGVLTIDALKITLLAGTQSMTIAQAQCGGAPPVSTNPSPMISAPAATGAGAAAMVGGVVVMRRRNRGKDVTDAL